MKIKHKIGFIVLVTMVDIFVILLVVMTNDKTSIQNDVNTKTSAHILASNPIVEQTQTEFIDIINEEVDENKTNENVEENIEIINNEQNVQNEVTEKQEPEIIEEPKEENNDTIVEEQPVEEINIENQVSYDDMTIEEREAALNDGTLVLEYSGLYTNSNERLTKQRGALYFNGHKETYYSERVLPGTGLNIPGRHVAEDGTVRDGDGYICVAADTSYLPKGSVLITSLGPAKVYDTGCAYGTIDIYVNW